MRIAFVTFWYPPDIKGGAGVYAENVTKELARLGHDVVVFAPQVPGPPEESPLTMQLRVVHVSTGRKLPFKALLFWLRLPRAVSKSEKERGFDLVYINGISYWCLKRLSSAPHLLTIHHLAKDAVSSEGQSLLRRLPKVGAETGVIVPLIEGICIRRADVITTVSRFTRDRILDVYGVGPEKVHLIHAGIAQEEYSFKKEELVELKRVLGLDDRPVILFVGRVDDPRKGLDLLLRMLPRILQRVDANLLIVGGGNPTKMKNLAQTLRVSDNVCFAGFVSRINLRKCYAICDVYAAPSRLEGFGLTLLEAMAAGKPVVSHDVGSIGEIIRSGENGILVDINDDKGFSEAICRYLVDKDLALSTGVKNRLSAFETFTWASAGEKLDRLVRASAASEDNTIQLGAYHE